MDLSRGNTIGSFLVMAQLFALGVVQTYQNITAGRSTLTLDNNMLQVKSVGIVLIFSTVHS